MYSWFPTFISFQSISGFSLIPGPIGSSLALASQQAQAIARNTKIAAVRAYEVLQSIGCQKRARRARHTVHKIKETGIIVKRIEHGNLD